MTNWKGEFLNLLINYTSRCLLQLKNVIKIPIMAIGNQDIKKVTRCHESRDLSGLIRTAGYSMEW